MPLPMKIQPIDNDFPANRDSVRVESGKPVLKSRLKRLLDRPFTSVLRSSNADKSFIAVSEESRYGRDEEFEPSSIVLAKMVQNYMEENNSEKQAKNGRSRCNCFNGNNDDSSDDEFDLFGESSFDARDYFKSLIPCASVSERNLLADAAKIVEKNKTVKRKDDLRKIIVDGLSSIGYDSSICKSKWDKTRSLPAGEYEYIDVIVNDERFLIDVDFQSEFEIARQTNAYKTLLQSLPFIFVGKSDRIGEIVSMVSEAAKQSLKKKGMYFPPWRKADYMRAKWLSSYTRISGNETPISVASVVAEPELDSEIKLIFEEKILSPLETSSSSPLPSVAGIGRDDDDVAREAKAVPGLASLFNEKKNLRKKILNFE